MADSDDLLEKVECPQCHSSGLTLAVYRDGHKHCFGPGCGYFEKSEEGGAKVVAFGKAPSHLLDPDWSLPENREGLHLRKLKPETCRKFGVFRHGWGGKGMVQVYPYYNAEGELSAQKLRLADKTFPVIFEGEEDKGHLTAHQLFGQHVFGDRFDRQVVVCEGELDALSVAQETNFKLAVVSVGAGSDGAVKNLKANYLWLDRFSEIILWFDNDEQGKKAANEAAALFKVGKVRIATAVGFKADGTTPCKDASDILQANRPGDIQSCVYAAVAWRPRGIVNAKDNASDVMAPREKVQSYSYPPSMEKLQAMTGGMFPGEVTYHVAGTGIGKSTNIREIVYHLTEQGCKVGVMSFEDTIRDIKLGLMSIPANERLMLRPYPDIENEKALAAYDKLMGKWHEVAFGGGKIELFDPETAEWTMEAIMGYGRYMAKALDCNVVVVEPISFIASSIDLKADERRVLDMVAAEFSKNAKELGISYIIAHHLKRVGSGVPHEEGAPTSLNELRSSGGLANFATAVIGWERNNQAEGDGVRVTQARIIKTIRRTGASGLADVLYYGENGRLTKSPIPFPPIGKPDEAGGGSKPSKPGFGAVSAEGHDY